MLMRLEPPQISPALPEHAIVQPVWPDLAQLKTPAPQKHWEELGSVSIEYGDWGRGRTILRLP